MKIVALIMFIIMYVLMIGLPKKRPYVAFITAIIFVILGILPVGKVLASVDWNVLMMIFGTMLIVDYFIDSKMPAKMADWLLDLAPNVMMVTIYMSLFAGIVSAFIDNVATVLMIAPVGLAICKKLKISPVPMLISIAVSSNLQGAATLVGDTTSIMLGAYAKMNFNDFIWMHGRPGMFFVVELSALATIPIMMWLFRKDKQPVHADESTEVNDYVPTFMMILHVVLLIIASFIPNTPSITNGVICMVCGIITIIWEIFISRGTASMKKSLKAVDYDTILLLAGLFVVIAGITEIGIINDLAKWIVSVGGNNMFLLYTIVIWMSVLISAFIDNIPYVATMLPVLASVTSVMGIEPYLLYFGLLVGATLGGNLTPIGASANITAVGMLRKSGYETSFRDFARIGLPFTLTAALVGYIMVWVIWA